MDKRYGEFTEEEVEIALKHMTRCLNWLLIKEVSVKTSLSCLLSQIRLKKKSLSITDQSTICKALRKYVYITGGNAKEYSPYGREFNNAYYTLNYRCGLQYISIGQHYFRTNY